MSQPWPMQPPEIEGPDARIEARSDAQLLAALRAGDVAAFEALFLRYHAQLCTFAYHFVESEAVAEEIVQDAFFFIWERRATWQLPDDSFRRYMFASVRNASVSQLRHRRVEERSTGDVVELAQQPAATDLEATQSELARAIRDAVTRLPDRCREVLVLHRQQGMSYQQIADVLGISRNTVEIHMGRAFKLLRKSLAHFQ